MRSRRLVAMVHCDVETLPEQEPRRIDDHALRPLREGQRDVHLQALEFELLILGEVLAAEVGVDRHLKMPASPEGRDEVQGDHAAFRANEFYGGFGKGDVHRDSIIPRETCELRALAHGCLMFAC